MMNYEERQAQLHAMLEDPDLALDAKEAFELIYRYVRFEFALIRLDRQEKRVEKRAEWLANVTEVYNFRKELAHHE